MGTRRIIGVDANVNDLVVTCVPDGPSGTLPKSFRPSTLDAVGLAELQDNLRGQLIGHDVDEVVIVSDINGRLSPSKVFPRAQMEAVLAVAAHLSGVSVIAATLGDALGHLGLDRQTGSKRKRLRSELSERVGEQWLTPNPARRSASLGVALWRAEVQPEEWL